MCQLPGREVAPEQIVKAYEYAKNKFIELDEEELEKLRKRNEERPLKSLIL
ncbi:Ku protein [Bacillus sp. SL00103]